MTFVLGMMTSIALLSAMAWVVVRAFDEDDERRDTFFKADDARPQDNSGFGLGLSIAQDIVKRHGGRIELMSGAPSGLRVLIALPPKHFST